MFQKPFSFIGRIRRTEYGISIIICYIIGSIINVTCLQKGLWIFCIVLAPLLWFLIAQGAKRCHDRGNNGWYQIIPFYVFWMLFADGYYGLNIYGHNPKEKGTQEHVIVKYSKRIFAAIFGLALFALGVWIIYDNLIGGIKNNNEYGVRIGVVPLPKEASDAVFSAGEIVLWMLPFLFGACFIYYAIKGKWD